MAQDIVLLTVDSWRYDTADLVPNLSNRLSGQSEAICAGAATNWAFPSILSGMHYPNAYDSVGGLRSDVTSLPQILSEAGYATGGFVACNPYVSKWESHFDEFWNGDIDSDSEEWYSSTLKKWLSRGYRTSLLKKRVPADEIAHRARDWYSRQEQPRFLWLHLMEPHLPYYPGIRNARKVGLLKAYRSIISYQRHHDDTPPEHMAVQRELYDRCVEVFDAHVPGLLDFVDDDAVMVALGDHGEEFDHGHFDHERLYDETVRVPLFFENVPALSDLTSARQIDLPATILQTQDLDVPTDWTGQGPTSLDEQPALMLTPQPDADLLHTGIRSSTTKIIKSFDRESGDPVSTEVYDIESDPEERENLHPHRTHGELASRLDTFVDDRRPALEMDASTGMESEVVESRLQDLGYK